MAKYLDWRLDELYPEERGVTTKKTGRRGPRGEGNFVWELPGAAFKSIMEGQQLQHETEQKIREGVKSEAGILAQKTWKGLKGSGPIQSRQRRETFQPIPWTKHPANPYTQKSEAEKHQINSRINVEDKDKIPPAKGSPADQGIKGRQEIDQEAKDKREKGEQPKKPGDKNKPKTGTNQTETKAQKNARQSKGLSMLASALGDQSVKTHEVRGFGLEWDGSSGYVG